MKKNILLLLLLPQIISASEFATDLSLQGGNQQSVSIDSRYALYETPQNVIFGNVRGGVGTTTQTFTPHAHDPFIEGNVGLGYRFSRESENFGIYSYYGKLKTPYQHYFSRFTFGAEYSNDHFGMFLNIYTPIGKRSKTIGRKFGFDKFQFNFRGHNLRFRNIGKRELMSPLALELGLKKCFGNAQVLLKGNIHSATMHAKNRFGTELSVNCPIGNQVFFNGSLGYDSFYQTLAQIGVIVTFGQSENAAVSRCHYSQLAPVYLEEFFWIQRGKKITNERIVKSDLYFVDNARIYSGGFQGDGTFENPYSQAILANEAIATVPDATVYFYQGNAPYQNFGTFNLIGSQTITGQGGNFSFQNILLLPGSDATRPFLARNAMQQAMNTPLITVTNGGSNIIENIGLSNVSGAVATGGSLITVAGSSINSLLINNVTAADKITLFFMSGSQSVTLTKNDIYGVDIKTFNASALDLKVQDNTFRTNTMIAQRFFQPIGASIFVESLNTSILTVNAMQNNQCFNTTLNGNAHLGFGYLSSGTSFHSTPNGFLNNSSFGKLPPASAGAFLFQGVNVSRVNINGCYDNLSATDEFTLRSCDINIKKAGFPGSTAGLSQANNNTTVLDFGAVNIFNNP